MTAPALFSSSPQAAGALRSAVAPYVAPARRAEPEPVVARVGPYVPRPWRPALDGSAASKVHTPTAPVTAPSTAPQAAMVVPTNIPPYRPLRPTPIASPAIRTPLYIPPVTAPSGEAAAVDEAAIEPALAETDELPWIDAFLSSTPGTPVGVVTVEPVEASEAVDAAEPVSLPAEPDEWPLDEAAAEFHELRARMPRVAEAQPLPAEPTTVQGPTVAEETPGPVPLAPWRDDDLMDILPVRRARATPQPLEAVGLDASAQEAAHALEVLARRVRAGELALPSFDPRMGEPAALVAALAALLGVRLR